MKNGNSELAKGDKIRMKKLRSLLDYIWDTELTSVSRFRRFGVKMGRIIHLVTRGFREDECSLHASALTFSTLMAIVPVLALSLALARGVGNVDVAKEKIRSAVVEWTSGFRSVAVETNLTSAPATMPKDATDQAQPELAEAINGMVDKVFKKVEDMKFKAIGGVGLVVLILMVIDVLGRVEAAFNRVWGVTSSRTIYRKFTDYLSVVIILPVLIGAASSLPVVSFAVKFLGETVAPGLRFFVGSAVLNNMTTVLLTALGFMFLLIFMPNTKVKVMSGFAGGFVTALLFIGWLWICAALQIGVANYSKIYGSFAVFPILLAWVYVSWGIVLFGAEVAFAVQNCSTYRMEQGARRANVQAKIILSLSVIQAAGRGLLGKGGGFDVASFAESRRIPVRFLNEVLDELVHAGFIGELSGGGNGFVLLKTPDSIKIKDVVDVIMHSGVEPKELGLGTMDPEIERVVKKAADGITESLSHSSVQDLLKE